ncbi:MAG TPA: MFS transporter [Acidimicrobiales bacterium]
MPRFTVSRTVDHDEAERLLAPRDDVVAEEPARADGGTATFTLAHGPFARYRRTVSLSPPSADGTVVATEDVEFRLPPGTWPFLVQRPLRSALRHPRPGGRLPWWFPPQRPDARGATVLGLLATLSLVVGYHGTLLTQTMTFAADEFGAGTAAQGDALAAVRIGGVIAIYLGAVADRRGRRLVLSLSLLACVATTALGAVAPSLPALAATQGLNRGTWAAASLLLAVIAAEEMPAGARAYALSLLAMTGALGAGLALWLLPVADLGTRSWRLLYALPLLFVPVILRFGRLVPESRRFVRPHRTVRFAGHYGRLALVAGTAFLLNVFMAPQSQFRNEFLREERGMAAASVSLFVLVTSTPAGIGILAGGRLADTRGRRVVGATGIAVGALLLTVSFAVDGPAMWLAALVGGIFAAALVPTITVYGPELFPTSLRGRANGIASTTAMAGSVVGLLSAGRLEEAAGSFARALAVLAVAPLAMAAVVLTLFPETARRELEDLNPEDREALVAPPGGGEGGERTGAPPAGPDADGVGTAAPG